MTPANERHRRRERLCQHEWEPINKPAADVVLITGDSECGARRGGPASRDIPHFAALAAFAVLGGLAAPGLRAFRRARATELRLRTERIRRYVEAQRGRA